MIHAAAVLLAALVTLPNTDVKHIRSEANDVEYKLYIALPNGYESGDRRYGVLYVLDADYSFAIARNVVEHLSDRDHLEPLIVVGVAYGGPLQYRLNRTRDYTPSHTLEGGYGRKMQKHSGGGAKFSRFLTRELVTRAFTSRLFTTGPRSARDPALSSPAS